MNKLLKEWLDAGTITQAQYDAAMAADPQNPEAWTARETAHAAEVARLTKERDDAMAREAAKDKIIVSFSTAPNRNMNPDADPEKEVIAYINKKRGIK